MSAPTLAKVAWLFPGQGSQSVGMGHAIAVASPKARAVFDRVDDALHPLLGRSLSQIMFEGPEAELTLTANAQPAIVATSVAILEALKERVPHLPAPSFAAGHSLGEYSALVAAGSMRVDDACRLVHLRGKAMQEAVAAGEGAMSAIIGLSASVVEDACREASIATGDVVSAANYNAPGQIVIAGGARGVASASALLVARKGKAIPLKVSAPFHCALMRPAAEVVRAALSTIELRTLSFPVIANVDAQPRTDLAEVKDALIRQVDSPVRWQSSVEMMVSQGVTHALEIGSGKVLLGLVKRIAPTVKLFHVNDLASLDLVLGFLTS
ncbi:MAG: ACP S-malonyltransferase [Polyangiales bacterium]